MSAQGADGLDGALRAAVEAAGSQVVENGGAPPDPMALLMRVLPALLENREEHNELLGSQGDDVGIMRKQLRFLRKQLHEMAQSHDEMLEELRLMREEQSQIVAHLARVQIMDELDDDEMLNAELDDDSLDDDDELYHAVSPTQIEKRRRNKNQGGPGRRGPRRH